MEDHVSPGEKNPIEGKFWQEKKGYGMNRIRALLKNTSHSWNASIILVLNLVKFAGEASFFSNEEAYRAAVYNYTIASGELKKKN